MLKRFHGHDYSVFLSLPLLTHSAPVKIYFLISKSKRLRINHSIEMGRRQKKKQTIKFFCLFVLMRVPCASRSSRTASVCRRRFIYQLEMVKKLGEKETVISFYIGHLSDCEFGNWFVDANDMVIGPNVGILDCILIIGVRREGWRKGKTGTRFNQRQEGWRRARARERVDFACNMSYWALPAPCPAF